MATEVAQPRIAAGSLAGLRVLEALGIDADAAVGHSLGELSALAWGGALGGEHLLDLAAARGRVMAEASHGGGAMAGLSATPAQAGELLAGTSVVIAGFNGPAQTVIAGEATEVEQVCRTAAERGHTATRVKVSHAFHSPLVQPAADGLATRLAETGFAPLERPVYSTVTGRVLEADADLRCLLRDQVIRPVRFQEAASGAAANADLLVEVGPGRILTGLMADIAPQVPALATDTDNASLRPLLTVVAAAHAAGVEVDTSVLLADRVLRPLPLDGSFTFLASPCEAAPDVTAGQQVLAPDDDADLTNEAGAAAGESTLDVLRRVVAERIELPVERLSASTHPLDDLHLSSITVVQVVNDVGREQGRGTLQATENFATVTLGELADMIDVGAVTTAPGDDADGEVPGVAPWVWPFSVDRVARPTPVAVRSTDGPWSVHAPAGSELAEGLRTALASSGVGGGVLLCLPDGDEPHVALLLEAARDALGAPEGTRFAVVGGRNGAAALARTLHLEKPSVPTTVVGLPDPGDDGPGVRDAVIRRVVDDVAATVTFSEVYYTAEGERTVPLLHALPPAQGHEAAGSPLDPGDVLLVTGGGKGITAECALAMATDSGATLVLVGRADPVQDAEVSDNLARMQDAGVRYRYERADVTSTEQMDALVRRVQADLGPVTAVLHGAGRNEPRALTDLTEEDFRGTLAPKVDGLRAVLGALDPDRIKLLVTFGSIIGRAGLRGEAHYATANDWLTDLTVRFGEEHPNTRVLALEWSVWSGAGMGERLGVVESLMRDGITPISIDDGIAVLRRVLSDPSAGPVLMVGGRAAGLPTLVFPQHDLPLNRFVDQVVVHYPGIELVTEAELSVDADPYLADHLLADDHLFPAVIGMEAMSQVASALTGRRDTPMLQDLEFLRPIVVRPGAATTVRIAALVRDAARVDVVIRSAETGFAADHFRASLLLPRPEIPAADGAVTPALPPVAVDPGRELYGELMFQGKRFQRLSAYRVASARRAVAELSTPATLPWFAAFMPQELSLADPGTRDAVMHGIQCCVPDGTLLPQAVERLYLAERDGRETDLVIMDARERSQDGDTYVYDVVVSDPSGTPVERWEGLRLRAVRKRTEGSWVPAMLGPHLERSLEPVLGGRRTVVVEPDPSTGPVDRRQQTALAAGRATGAPVTVRYHPDGRPEIDDAWISASHGAGLTLLVAADHRIGCDVETVEQRSDQDWADLLGADRLPVRDLIAADTGESVAAASTRVWCALEALRKAGSTTPALTVDERHEDGWLVLSSDGTRIATWVTVVTGVEQPVVFAVLSGEEK